MSATTYAWLVLALPLAGSLTIAFGYRLWPGRAAGWIGTAAIGLAFLASIGALTQLLGEPSEHRQLTSSLWDYASAAGVNVKLGILVDPLSVFMILVVTGVSTLIHLYSVSYVESDRGYARFFSYLNFFVFSMLLLLLAGNFVLLIVGWAFVGFASYALISFWYRRETATKAGMKAFVINVVGDVGLVLAAFFVFRELHAFDYLTVFQGAAGHFHTNQGVVVAICLLLLVGAFAKSAQLPLHTWLPDAMEGPTPVSALIHAATMVTAGVYLIARMHPLFELAPTAADIAAFIGLATVIVAASIALVVTDLKRIIAYSTMSQIGYMVVGVSIGAYTAGMFHLMTHAFFKALLFMAAGSVIAAMASRQDIDRMGGFRRSLPYTSLLLIVGALALSGFPGTSGFFSKDEILVFAAERGGFYWIFAIAGYAAAAMTAFYSFRIVFRVCYGEPCPEAEALREGHMAHAEPENPVTGEPEDTDVGFPGPEHHVAEQARSMAIAMGCLGLAALVGGFVQIPGVSDAIGHFLEGTFANSKLATGNPPTGDAYLGLLAGAVVSVLGIGLAYLLYVVRPGLAPALRTRLSGVHRFLVNRWYFDELIDAVVVRPTLWLGRFFDDVIERRVVQGLVEGTVGVVRGTSTAVRFAQSGFVRAYALLLITGFAGLGLYFLIVSS
ncbi:MAG: NADH-quinone oxidoreductase subunit [Solirubrobacterales bacterium]|jgi:NADH-quinone oxidoreductase subunit L|nr:NADH-quinone oxidoreductase subunit [Solirubrobacterales bacterium]